MVKEEDNYLFIFHSNVHRGRLLVAGAPDRGRGQERLSPRGCLALEWVVHERLLCLVEKLLPRNLAVSVAVHLGKGSDSNIGGLLTKDLRNAGTAASLDGLNKVILRNEARFLGIDLVVHRPAFIWMQM